MNRAILERARQKASERAYERAVEATNIARDTHRDAPRGGTARNYFGEPRSAPKEPPAMEFGGLYSKLVSGAERTDKGGRAPVNYKVLEFGYQKTKKDGTSGGLEPRPLGALTAAELRRRVKG